VPVYVQVTVPHVQEYDVLSGGLAGGQVHYLRHLLAGCAVMAERIRMRMKASFFIMALFLF
jgi:hypothetical protein